MTDDRLLTTEQLSDYLQIPVATIRRWRHRLEGPAGIRVGRHVRYRETAVQEWLDRQAAQERSARA
jgi:excisionase family DNA binding protein